MSSYQVYQAEYYHVFLSTWVGDPHKIIMLEQVVKVIKEDSLLDLVKETGNTIMRGLYDLEKRFPELLSRARGLGTLCAIDVKSLALRDKIINDLRQQGINLGGCGEASIRIRPSLTFTPHHADIMLQHLDDVITDLYYNMKN